jgi:hypothetical protein
LEKFMFLLTSAYICTNDRSAAGHTGLTTGAKGVLRVSKPGWPLRSTPMK